MLVETQKQEHEAAGYIVSIVGKQRKPECRCTDKVNGYLQIGFRSHLGKTSCRRHHLMTRVLD